MFDIGWQELFLIGVVALIVVGPKDLPKALRTGARLLNKARAISREFQAGLAEIAREAELDELKRNVEKAARFDPAEELKRAVDPTGRFTEDFDPSEFNRKLKAAVEGGPPSGPAAPSPAVGEPLPGAMNAPAPLPQPVPGGGIDVASHTASPEAVPGPDTDPGVGRPSGAPEAGSRDAAPDGSSTHR